MVSQKILKQISDLAYPGMVLYFSELKNLKDNKTISDIDGSLAKALSSNNKKDIASIVEAIYRNSSYKGTLVNHNNKIVIMDSNKPYELSVTNSGSVLTVKDALNKKVTQIEYKASPKKEVKVSLQDQILKVLKSKKMSDAEVIAYLKEWGNQ